MKVFSNILKDNKIIFKKNERPISIPEKPYFSLPIIYINRCGFRTVRHGVNCQNGRGAFKARFKPSERSGFSVNMNYILPPICR